MVYSRRQLRSSGPASQASSDHPGEKAEERGTSVLSPESQTSCAECVFAAPALCSSDAANGPKCNHGFVGNRFSSCCSRAAAWGISVGAGLARLCRRLRGAVPTMSSFQEVYCASTGCSPPRFSTRVFWRCLNPVTAFIAALLGGPSADFFSADRDLIAQVGRAANMDRIREEVRDYLHDPRNRTWLPKLDALLTRPKRSRRRTSTPWCRMPHHRCASAPLCIELDNTAEPTSLPAV